jgi:alkylmercury lyase-like protein
MTENSDLQRRIRVFIYTHIADSGAPPSAERIAIEMSLSVDAARQSLESLATTRQVILDPKTGDIWMAGPFSGVPTRFRVNGDRTSWWANCAWDMLGIPAALSQSARVDARCADCDETFHIDVDGKTGPVGNVHGLVHILLPASRWYADIGFTWSTMLFFRSEEHLTVWLDDHKTSRGAVLTLEETWRLAKAWYVDRRDPAWRPRSREEAQAVLDGVGLTEPFWKLGW